MQKLIYKAVEKDRLTAPFRMIGTEMKVSSDLEFSPGKSVRLEGTLDRVHYAHETVHIVDYKTGKADLISKETLRNDIVQYVQMHFDEPRYKSGFQGLFYGYLWGKIKGNNPVKLGVYPLKKVNKGIQWLYFGQTISIAGFNEFEKQLTQVLQDLFDESIPFTQTDDPERCRFCAYKEICQR